MEGSSLLYVTTVLGLVAIGIVIVDIKCFSFITWPHVTTRSKGCLIVSHHFAKFSGHRPYGTSDAAAKIVNVTLQDHVIKGSGDFMERIVYLHPAKIDSHKYFVNGYIIILVCEWYYKAEYLYGYVTLWVEVTQGKSSSCLVLWL